MRHFTHDELKSLAALCAGAALLVAVAVVLSGGVGDINRLAPQNSSSQTAATPYGTATFGLPSYGGGYLHRLNCYAGVTDGSDSSYDYNPSFTACAPDTAWQIENAWDNWLSGTNNSPPNGTPLTLAEFSVRQTGTSPGRTGVLSYIASYIDKNQTRDLGPAAASCQMISSESGNYSPDPSTGCLDPSGNTNPPIYNCYYTAPSGYTDPTPVDTGNGVDCISNRIVPASTSVVYYGNNPPTFDSGSPITLEWSCQPYIHFTYTYCYTHAYIGNGCWDSRNADKTITYYQGGPTVTGISTDGAVYGTAQVTATDNTTYTLTCNTQGSTPSLNLSSLPAAIPIPVTVTAPVPAPSALTASITSTVSGVQTTSAHVGDSVVMNATFTPSSGDTLQKTGVADYMSNYFASSVHTTSPWGATYTYVPSATGSYLFYARAHSASYPSDANYAQVIINVCQSGSNWDGASCVPNSCTFDGSTVLSGSSVTAYQAPSVPSGSTCTSQSRTCTNGTLSGSYAYSSCTVAAPVSCANGAINPPTCNQCDGTHTYNGTSCVPIACTPNWSCSTWGACSGGTQTCTAYSDSKSCGVPYSGTPMTQSCTPTPTPLSCDITQPISPSPTTNPGSATVTYGATGGATAGQLTYSPLPAGVTANPSPTNFTPNSAGGSVPTATFTNTNLAQQQVTVTMRLTRGTDFCSVGATVKVAAAAPSITKPGVVTNAISPAPGTTATLSGSITSTGGQNASARGFQWGTSPTLGAGTQTITQSGSFGAVTFTAALSGLTPGTPYYYRAYATNGAGTGNGLIKSFTLTLQAPPTVVTNAATGPSATGATLNGTANPNGSAATGYFRYCKVGDSGCVTAPAVCTDAFGTRTPVAGGTALGAGGGPVLYSRNISGLTSGTTYYYCAIARNGGGVGLGNPPQHFVAGAPAGTIDTVLTVNPSRVRKGGSVTLSWQTSNMTSCSVTDQNGILISNAHTSPGTIVSNITQTTIFTLSCIDARGNPFASSVPVTILPTYIEI